MLELLYEALHSEVGIAVPTDNVDLLRQRLYKLRKEDPQLECLSFVTSPFNPGGELWIVKARPQENPDEEE